jgi:hypothetical protein
MLGAILIQSDYEGHYAGLLERLGQGSLKESGPISMQEATHAVFDGTALGSYQKATILINHFLPYDCSHQADHPSDLDRRLANLSTSGQLLCFYLDETSMSFGFSVFQNGERVRARKVDPQQIYADFGIPLPAEAPFDPANRDDSARILAITEALLGKPMNRLIVENQPPLTAYVDDPQVNQNEGS